MWDLRDHWDLSDLRHPWDLGVALVRGTPWDAWEPADATRECDRHLRVADARVGKCASLA
eukprot:6511635-Pyramimonas_sp.AAC.1